MINVFGGLVHTVKLDKQRLKDGEEVPDVQVHLGTVSGTWRQAEPVQLPRRGGGTGAVRGGAGGGPFQRLGVLTGRAGGEGLHPFKAHFVAELQKTQKGPLNTWSFGSERGCVLVEKTTRDLARGPG